MITASIGGKSFDQGPTFYFNGSTFAELCFILREPEPTVDYVNQLPGVNTDQQEIREVAASGIARLALAHTLPNLLGPVGKMLISIVGQENFHHDDFFSTYDKYLGDDRKKLSGHKLDTISVLATRKNEPERTADVIETTAPTDGGYFVIALANGGLISAAQTFRHLSQGDHAFGMVLYSRYKNGDHEPLLYPSKTERIEWLKNMAHGRQVVVYDEDCCTDKTLRVATEYFTKMLGTKVLGISPVQVERSITYRPYTVFGP